MNRKFEIYREIDKQVTTPFFLVNEEGFINNLEEIRKSLGRAIKILHSIDCHIVSLHGHTSSKDRAVSNFKIIVNSLLRVRHKYGLNPKYINIGGGYWGPVPKGMLFMIYLRKMVFL